uniref:Uncharacterized protein n=1 Tax=Cacopsylla melanoneura TaxID=428564 RepID=A0A8D8VG55_9HEMI
MREKQVLDFTKELNCKIPTSCQKQLYPHPPALKFRILVVNVVMSTLSTRVLSNNSLEIPRYDKKNREKKYPRYFEISNNNKKFLFRKIIYFLFFYYYLLLLSIIFFRRFEEISLSILSSSFCYLLPFDCGSVTSPITILLLTSSNFIEIIIMDRYNTINFKNITYS